MKKLLIIIPLLFILIGCTNKEEENYRKRVSDFIKVTNNKKPIIYTMITPFGIMKNLYSGMVARTITLEDLMSI